MTETQVEYVVSEQTELDAALSDVMAENATLRARIDKGRRDNDDLNALVAMLTDRLRDLQHERHALMDITADIAGESLTERFLSLLNDSTALRLFLPQYESLRAACRELSDTYGNNGVDFHRAVSKIRGMMR